MRTKNYDRKAWSRFLSKIRKSDSCWEWAGHLTSEGYGRFLKGDQARSQNETAP